MGKKSEKKYGIYKKENTQEYIIVLVYQSNQQLLPFNKLKLTLTVWGQHTQIEYNHPGRYGKLLFRLIFNASSRYVHYKLEVIAFTLFWKQVSNVVAACH